MSAGPGTQWLRLTAVGEPRVSPYILPPYLLMLAIDWRARKPEQRRST